MAWRQDAPLLSGVSLAVVVGARAQLKAVVTGDMEGEEEAHLAASRRPKRQLMSNLPRKTHGLFSDIVLNSSTSHTVIWI